jgi:hypothetical protein
LKKVLILTAALVAAVVVFTAITLPPRRLALPPAPDETVAGVIHIHTNRSDGLSGPDEIAAAAARAGLKFIVFTDHGDATRAPDSPVYRSGVLCMDGVEISTNGGHYVAIDMPASPYPLGGEAADVVEDVRRLGGFGIAAHPDSPKTELSWRDWTAPIDAVELLNLDTGWRVLAQEPGWAPRQRLAAALLHYPFRPPEVIARLIAPTRALDRWVDIAARRRVVSIAGADAHAKLAPRNADPGDSGFALSLPSYEASFRVMSIHVRPDQPLQGQAAADAAVLMRAIRNGHLYTAVDGFATPPSFDFTATNDHGTVREGDQLSVGGSVTLHVRSNAPATYVTHLHAGRDVLKSEANQEFSVTAPEGPGVYWVEVTGDQSVPARPWLRSNAIYVTSANPPAPIPPPPSPRVARALFDGRTAAGWRIENDPLTPAAVDADGGTGEHPELRFRFGLSGGTAVGQFAALVRDLPEGVPEGAALSFSARAERAMRVSVQIRDTAADRWQRSVYLDVGAAVRTLSFDDFVPVGATRVAKPARDAIRGVMFVVDTTNTRPGSSGRVWFRDVALTTPATSGR